MTAHHVHRSVDEAGWRASCNCGWSCVYDARVSRDVAADAHRDYASRRPWPKGKTTRVWLDAVTRGVVPAEPDQPDPAA